MNKPKVSIVIPLYNQKEFVEESIKSSLAQTYPEVEIIVVNDGSTDDPEPILSKFADRIRVINQENKGLSAARNAGIRESTGEYIQLLDSDDTLHPDKIKLQLENSTVDDSTISYCDIRQHNILEDNEFINYIGSPQDMFDELYAFWRPYPLLIHSMLIKKTIFDKFGLFDENLRAAEDRLFCAKIATQNVKFEYFQFVGGYRRLHGENMSKDASHMLENFIKSYLILHKTVPEDYIAKKFNYSPSQMLSANATAYYYYLVRKLSSSSGLMKCTGIFKKYGVSLFADPIPMRVSFFKVFVARAYSYFVRYVQLIKIKCSLCLGRLK